MAQSSRCPHALEPAVRAVAALAKKRERCKMNKFVPYEKMSKKRQKLEDKKNRQDWGSVKPVTQVAKNGKAYARSKIRQWEDYSNSGGSFFAFLLKHSLKPVAAS
jgi:hypothetical protein